MMEGSCLLAELGLLQREDVTSRKSNLSQTKPATGFLRGCVKQLTAALKHKCRRRTLYINPPTPSGATSSILLKHCHQNPPQNGTPFDCWAELCPSPVLLAAGARAKVSHPGTPRAEFVRHLLPQKFDGAQATADPEINGGKGIRDT